MPFPWVGAMSTGESWDVNRHTARRVCIHALVVQTAVWLRAKTSNLSKGHVTRDSSGPATLAISVGHAALNRQRWAAIVTMASDTNGRWAHGYRWCWWWCPRTHLARLWRYTTWKLLGSWPWPFGVTWRDRLPYPRLDPMLGCWDISTWRCRTPDATYTPVPGTQLCWAIMTASLADASQ